MSQNSQHDTQQNKSQSQSSSSTGSTQSDRERSITPQREGGSASSGITRRPQSGLTGRVSDPFSLMRRMSEDMDRLFQQFGFGRGSFGLTPLLGSDWSDDLWDGGSSLTQSTWSPQVETFRRGENF